ncbi:hypothetical protein CIL03_09715 [Virgibacillus indicus]|uniref:Spore coat protein YutH n=2 Tax=Virgibacillus indicus TaxID=2024554 RepID=A0A265NA31_9BACI|nr:hypothetical protein CIL03_09715 [Virgibacillus indicus]
MIRTYYAIQTEEKVMLDGRDGYKQDEYVYFTISADNKEIIHMEQAALAYYLMENRYSQLAVPIPNIHGDWITKNQGSDYMVFQLRHNHSENPYSSGASLGNFHQVGSAYSYEPKSISSYGQWKQLWINKLSFFENHIEEDSRKNPSSYYRLLMDVLPYIIGISENGIQYLQESNYDHRFHEADQGTIAFRRYSDQLSRPVIWAEDLFYDHPVRDIAEVIRFMMLNNKETQEIGLFINEYQSVRPLSVFSWRLLYARLIFPIHFFDLMERGIKREDPEQSYIELQSMLEKQNIYEKKLKRFFETVNMDHEALQIPVLHWL